MILFTISILFMMVVFIILTSRYTCARCGGHNGWNNGGFDNGCYDCIRLERS